MSPRRLASWQMAKGSLATQFALKKSSARPGRRFSPMRLTASAIRLPPSASRGLTSSPRAPRWICRRTREGVSGRRRVLARGRRRGQMAGCRRS
eukprot:14463644-Alexandrium_andersonii.AAC.1